uniref:Bromodomain adjacent to zinc finger domain 2B n=1 Tax=Oncorhynchus kisutch TaxID=8019 RepID=A0A8C7MV99_ONCKI
TQPSACTPPAQDAQNRMTLTFRCPPPCPLSSSEWWRAAEAHSRGAAAFLPPFLGLPTMFTPHIQQNHSPLQAPSRTPSKNGQIPKGTATPIFLTLNPSDLETKIKWSKCTLVALLIDGFSALMQKPSTKPAEVAGVSDSESGSSSDSSSDGAISSDLEDLGGEEDDDDDDDDDDEDEEEDGKCEVWNSEKEKARRAKKKMKMQIDSWHNYAVFSFLFPCFIPLSPSRSLSFLPALSPSHPPSFPPSLPPFQSLLSQGQTFPAAQPKKQQGHRTSRKAAGVTSSSLPTKLPPALLPPPSQNNHSNLFLSSALLGLVAHPNGVIQSTTAQDAPLALITKPRKDSNKDLSGAGASLSLPVNLSTGGRAHLASSQGPPARPATSPSPATARGPRKIKAPKAPKLQAHAIFVVYSIFGVTVMYNSEHYSTIAESPSDYPSLSGTLLSDSDSNSESDADISGGKLKDPKLKLSSSGSASKREKTPLKLTKGHASLLSNSTNHTATSCSPLNLQVIKTPNIVTSSSAGKRKRVMDEQELRIPLELGWQRETRIKSVSGKMQGDVAYYAPCGKKLRQYPDVMKGLQWSLLKDEDVIPHILAMEGRRGRPPNSERQRGAEGGKGSRRRKGRPSNVGEGLALGAEVPSPSEAKLLRKLEAQEIARQAAQMKMMRKLEKQAMARAAKEARKQQAIMAAEERRKQKEQMKIIKQQEKIKRIQQIRLEKEMRAQQILEVLQSTDPIPNISSELAERHSSNASQSLSLLCPYLLRCVTCRERRRQHGMLMKAVEARKKAEERERLRQEKRDEKRLNKERKLELRRLELEIARELKKPNEDMCLADHKPLPEFSRIPGLILPGGAVSDCLMLMQFLRGFGKVLGFDVGVDVPTLGMLQEGLLNVGDSMGHVQDLLVRLLSLAVCDPGLPPGHKTKTMLGDHLTNVGINRDNVSEVLQMYMGAHCGQTDLAELALSLKTKAFQAHTPTQKASILGFLANELACSKSVVSEIDKNLDHMTNMRKDKWLIEGKLKKLRTIHAKRTGKRDTSMGGEEAQPLGTPSSGLKRKRKAGAESDDDDEEDEDSDDLADEDDEEEEEEMKKGKKVETCDEDDGDQSTSVEELEKQIEKLAKQQHQVRRKLFEASHSLRSMMYGQDRYRRRYWVLPHCGGVFIEAMESGEAAGELENERERRRAAAGEVHIKEEPQEEEVQKKKPGGVGGEERSVYTPVGSEEGKEEKKGSPNLFLLQSASLSKLTTLLHVAKEVAKATREAEADPHPKYNGSPIPLSAKPGYPSSTSSPSSFSSLLSPPPQLFSPMKTSTLIPNPPQLQYLPSDQLLRVLTERSGHWFTLLPRSPCDETSLTTSPSPGPGPLQSSPLPTSSLTRPRSPSASPALPLTPSAASASASPHHPAGFINYPLSALQGKAGGSLLGLSAFCGGWPSGMLSPSQLPFCSSPLPGHSGLSSVEGSANVAPSVSNKSESPVPPGEKLSSTMPSPAMMEVPKHSDHPTPRHIPEEMLSGWWRVSDIEELRSLVESLHSRGVREKVLHRQVHKYMELIPQVCTKHRDAAMIELCELEESQVSVESVRGWCVEEQAMEMDIAVLQQVEELERKVTTASLQVKGWMYPEPQSEREDLVYHEHKPLPKHQPAAGGAGDKDQPEDKADHKAGGVVRHADNPLDIAVTRLADLERNIERRYLRSPLGTTIQIRLDNVGAIGTVTVPAPSSSADREGGEEEVAHGMKVWRKALGDVRSAAQLAMCLQQLQKSIAWERSIMKVYCQICRKGDNEDLLLLCDGCDKGCHTYCHKPKITTIPEGDWYCPACISKASGPSPKNKKLPSKPVAGGGGKKPTAAEAKRNGKQAGNSNGNVEVSEDDSASASGTPKKGGGAKEPPSRKRKGEESPALSQAPPTPQVLLAELERHQDAWPFLNPVNTKGIPGYRKVIKKPMDFATIREKLVSSQYQNLETFIIDVNLVFDNCEKFNEDNSDIGRAGHNMRKFFDKRWTELLNQIN